MRDTKRAFRVLLERRDGNNHLEDLGIDGRVKLK